MPRLYGIKFVEIIECVFTKTLCTVYEEEEWARLEVHVLKLVSGSK